MGNWYQQLRAPDLRAIIKTEIKAVEVGSQLFNNCGWYKTYITE